MIVIGLLNGFKSVRQILRWADKLKEDMCQLLDMEDIPSPPTVSRMLSGIDEEEFVYLFADWIGSIVNTRGIHVAIDGKALRGSTEKSRGGGTPYILNLIDTETGIVLRQIPISLKTNEITAIPKLLDIFQIKDNMFTIDSIGTQIEIVKQIDSNGGWYLLPVKKNQKKLYEEIMEKAAAEEERQKEEKEKKEPKDASNQLNTPSTPDTQSTFEKNRGRIERRTDQVWTIESGFGNRTREFQGVKVVGTMERLRQVIRRDANGDVISMSEAEFREQEEASDSKEAAYQKIGFISNKELSAEEAARMLRDHWKIEDSLHYVLDDTFREDKSNFHGGKNNMALLRKVAYNILRLYTIHEGEEQQVRQESSMQDALTDFMASKDMHLIKKYVFSGIASLY